MKRKYKLFLLPLLTIPLAMVLPKLTRSASPAFTEIERGRYLVAAGDCASCHTNTDAADYAGGRAIPTPFGTLYSPNITPDKNTGIGNWSDDDFYRAMHEGVDPGGKHYYPAFPYPWFTKMTRSDVSAVRAYLMTLPPVNNKNKAPELPWPLSIRSVMAVWNELYFKQGTFVPDRSKSPEWNRGAYLVEGPAHCSACHTPRSALGGTKSSEAFEGGYGENWYAPNLTGDLRTGLGAWSLDDVVAYLKTGSNKYASASGPMSEVVERSTQKLSDEDLKAIATYLKDLPPAVVSGASNVADVTAIEAGRAVYADNCIGCHRVNGRGEPGVFPPLAGNAVVQSSDPANAIRVVLNGARAATTQDNPTGLVMPAFGWKLTDADVANLMGYLRASFGNKAGSVTADAVAKVRRSTLHK